MFQNISGQDVKEEINRDNKKTKQIKPILKNMFSITNIIIYIIAFMASTVSILDGMTIFGIAIFAAACSSGVVAGPVYIATLIGTFIGHGKDAFLSYLLTSLFFVFLIVVVRPRPQEDTKNEKMLVGKHLIFAIICVQALNMFSGHYLIADLLITILQSILAYIFYKIFVNSLPVVRDIIIKKAFTLEEVIGASLLVSIAISAIHMVSIYNISITIVLSILLVLIIGWKNGGLVGTTTGLTMGVVLAIIGIGQNDLIVTYSIAGLIAGVISRFGKIGVLIGTLAFAGLLFYIESTNIQTGIYLKELLIAWICLLLVPKSVQIDIEDIIIGKKRLPITMGNILAAGKETISKLNGVSDAITEMAKGYEEASATTTEDIDSLKNNKSIFISEMQTSLETISDNILYDDLIDEENGILDEIFEVLLKKDELEEEDLVKIFENHNSYIILTGEDNASKQMKNSVFQILKNINYTYKISKINFVWNQKAKTDRQNMSKKLNVVSKVISNIADEIEVENEKVDNEAEEIRLLAKQKEIEIKDVIITKQKNGKYIVKLGIYRSNNSRLEKLENILSKVFNYKINYICKEDKLYKFESEDKFKLELGISSTTKNNSEVSGDSSLQTRLRDGKYLLAISDGMGSGKIARNSSQRVVTMLEKLLTSGFEKETSLELINTAMTTSVDSDMYATIDAAIMDLYTGNVEFIKNGACNTYIKTKQGVQTIKEASVPLGMSTKVKMVEYDKDLEKGDIILMCSDGVQDSGENNWIKNILSKMQTDNVQKMADIIIREAIDNNFGNAKDDMTIIIARVV